MATSIVRDALEALGIETHRNYAPETASNQCVVLSAQRNFGTIHYDSRDPVEHTIQMDVYAPSFGACEALADQIADAFHGKREGDWLHSTVEQMATFYEEESGLHRIVLTLSLLHR